MKKKKAIGQVFQEFVVDEFNKSGMSMRKFTMTYPSVSIATLDRIFNYESMIFKTNTMDKIMKEFNTDFTTILKKYGEYYE